MDLCCFTWAFSSCGEQGPLFIAVTKLLLLWLLLSWSTGSRVRGISSCHFSSIVVVPGLSYFMAHGIFPDQGSNPCLLHWHTSTRAKPLQSCPTLCDPMDCKPPGSSVHGDSPSNAVPSSRGSS